MNIYDKKYIKDYIKEQLRSFYEKHGWKHLEVFWKLMWLDIKDLE